MTRLMRGLPLVLLLILVVFVEVGRTWISVSISTGLRQRNLLGSRGLMMKKGKASNKRKVNRSMNQARKEEQQKSQWSSVEDKSVIDNEDAVDIKEEEKEKDRIASEMDNGEEEHDQKMNVPDTQTPFGDSQAKNAQGSVEEIELAVDGDMDTEEGRGTWKGTTIEDLLRIGRIRGVEVVLPSEPQAKFERCFMEASPSVREKYRVQSVKTGYQEMVDLILRHMDDEEAFRDVCLANLDLLGSTQHRILTALKLRAQKAGDIELARKYATARTALVRMERAIHAGFYTLLKEQERLLVRYMGSLQASDYAGPDAASTCITWIILKALVAEWQRRYDKAVEGYEMLLSVEPPALPQLLLPPATQTDIDRAGSMTTVTSRMSEALLSSFRDRLTPELIFLDDTLRMNSTTEVRRYMIQEFSEQYNMPPDVLREKLRLMRVRLEYCDHKSYSSFKRALNDVYYAVADGTDDSFDPYQAAYEDLRVETYGRTQGSEFRRVPKTPKSLMSTRGTVINYDETFKLLQSSFPAFSGEDWSAQDGRAMDEGWMELFSPGELEEDPFVTWRRQQEEEQQRSTNSSSSDLPSSKA